MANKEFEQFGKEAGGRLYLFGTIGYPSSKTLSEYRVEWEASSLGVTDKIDYLTLIPAIKLAQKLKERTRVDPTAPSPISERAWNALLQLDPIEKENMESLNIDSDEAEDSSDDDEALDGEEGELFPSVNESILDSFLRPGANERAIEEEGILWRYGETLPSPANCSRGERTTLKPDARLHFINPLSSFLAFVPIEMWKVWLFHTNKYGATAAEQSGRVFQRFSLQEFMVFFGILMKMTLRPTPGQRYTACWDDSSGHPYVRAMSRTRFTELRSCLSMSDRSVRRTGDSLYRVRPLMTVLKKTLGAYVNIGSEVSLDESSVASRSKYAREFIFYNATKPDRKSVV